MQFKKIRVTVFVIIFFYILFYLRQQERTSEKMFNLSCLFSIEMPKFEFTTQQAMMKGENL